MFRNVKYLIPATEIDMGGIPVKQTLPTNNVDGVDPFLLLHHGKFSFTENASALHQGIGPHPHRGFSPVTFVIEGEVHHRDSWGNNQIAKKSEVQWMNAGAGIIHSERPSKNLAEKNGTQEIIQLWINTPASKKMKPPQYQYIPEEKMPVVVSDDNLVTNKLVAGSWNNLRSRTETESELQIIWSEAKAGGVQTFTVPDMFNVMLYVIRGNIRIKTYGKVDPENLVVFDNKNETIEITAETDTQ